MGAENSNSKLLAQEIMALVDTCLPTPFERNVVHQSLQRKIEKLLASKNPPEALPQARQVTMVIAQIHGFRELAETYSAKVVMDLLNRYFSLMSDVVIRYRGTLGRIMGESMTVLFGAPERHSDDVERALACAIAMQHAMATINYQNKELGLPELFMGVGINTGHVLAGSIGVEQNREFSILGSEVDLASKIESRALRGQVLISESTYRLASSTILVGESRSVQVKSKRKSVELYELLGTTLPRPMTVPRREVRKSPRVAVSMPCYFEQVVNKQIKSQPCKAEVIDIGYDGLLMISSVRLNVHSEIKMDVSLALLGKNTTDMFARVLQCESIGQGFRCGPEFISVDLAGKKTIRQFVDNMIER